LLRIEIDRDKCVGSGNCVFWAPATFDLDDEGFSVVIDPSGETEERIRVAVEGCPSKALFAESVEAPEPVGEPLPGDGLAPEEREPEEREPEEREPEEREPEEEEEGDHGHRLVR
jgi:ferredoxin